jgi:hypothetical protein
VKTKWLYLSFVDKEGKFVGAAYVQSGDSPLIGTTWSLDVPEGQIAIMEIPEDKEQHIPKDHKYHARILTKEELRKATPDKKLVNTRGEPR